MTAKAISQDYTKLREASRGVIIMLTVQLLLGMAVNLIGLPEEVSGGAKSVTTISLLLHVIVGVGLIVAAIRTLRVGKLFDDTVLRLTRIGALTVGVTFIFGALTMITGDNWWSYLMAVGFMAAVLLYGSIFMYGKS